MWFPPLLPFLGSSSGRQRAQRGGQPLRRRPALCRLAIEALEARCLLSYNVLDLGAFTGFGLNNVGQVVGYGGDAVLWQNGSLIHLGAGSYSSARSVNDAGQVVGYGYFGGSS